MKYQPITMRFIWVIVFAMVFLLGCKQDEKKQPTEHKYTNALIDETSPYLLQHAHNPVDWRAWSQQALEDAKKENKLVLISIGYSSCHWCHVMEEETFEDEEVAKLMNENFINIKVDREERPDVDQIYQTFVQLIDSNSGWPLNVIVLPNGKPLYGGTYHTKEQWTEVLSKIGDMYKNDPKKAGEYADMVAAGIQETNIISPVKDSEVPMDVIVKNAIETWKPNWDLEWGGDKGAEKFMVPVNLDFLLDYALLNEDELAKAHVKNTLDKMIMGGVYDHIGGGFFRYSTDEEWKVPHFEKMLYDNAQLVSLFSKAYQVFKDPKYHKVVLETIAFLERDMKNDAGGYFAALDADSEGEEGKFYIWEEEELKNILGTDFERFSKYYNIAPEHLWKESYVLFKREEDQEFAKKNDISPTDLGEAKENWKKQLLEARVKRPRPNVDDKIITSWNALLINGYVDAYQAFGNEDLLTKATEIFSFLKENSYEDNELVHTYKEGSRKENGFIEDYAFLMNASLNLYAATFNKKYYDFAQELNATANKDFSDDGSPMYRYNKDQELISKIIKTDDGVLPSPNSMMAHNLFLIGHIEYNPELLEKSKRMFLSMSSMIRTNASSYGKWNSLLLNHAYPYFEIAVVGKQAKTLVRSLGENYIPNALIVGSDSENDMPLFKDRYEADDTYIYVCQNTTCKLPVKTVKEALVQIDTF